MGALGAPRSGRSHCGRERQGAGAPGAAGAPDGAAPGAPDGAASGAFGASGAVGASGAAGAPPPQPNTKPERESASNATMYLVMWEALQNSANAIHGAGGGVAGASGAPDGAPGAPDGAPGAPGAPGVEGASGVDGVPPHPIGTPERQTASTATKYLVMRKVSGCVSGPRN